MTKKCPSCHGLGLCGEHDEPCGRCFGSGELEVFIGRIRRTDEDEADNVDQMGLFE